MIVKSIFTTSTGDVCVCLEAAACLVIASTAGLVSLSIGEAALVPTCRAQAHTCTTSTHTLQYHSWGNIQIQLKINNSM